MEVKDFDPLIKDEIFHLLDKIEENKTAFKDDLKKAYGIYSKGLDMTQLDHESFQIGYFMGYFQLYFRDLSYQALQRVPTTDENNYYLEIIQSMRDKILDIIRK